MGSIVNGWILYDRKGRFERHAMEALEFMKAMNAGMILFSYVAVKLTL